MNILLISGGTRGDINPFLALGVALKSRGHNVTLISSEIYEPLAHAIGVKFISGGTEEQYMEVINNPDFYNPKKSFTALAECFFLDPMRVMYDIIKEFDPATTVIVTLPFLLGARVASEKLNFPIISIALHPMTIWSIETPPIYPGVPALFYQSLYFLRKIILNLTDRYLMDKTLAPKLNCFRSELGLPKVNHIYSKWMFSPTKIIGLFPSWFGAPASDWPQNVELTGFIEYSENQPIPDEVNDFLRAGPPPILFTYGTGVAQGHKFFETSIQAVRKLGQRALILTKFPAQLPKLDARNELFALYLPFKAILPHVAAIVHHGGIGTIAQALSCKVPQLIVPLTHDQPDNAHRLEKLGLSFTLYPKKYTVTNAVAKLQQLLNSRSIKDSCETYSSKINFSGALEQACSIIEDYGVKECTTQSKAN